MSMHNRPEADFTQRFRQAGKPVPDLFESTERRLTQRSARPRTQPAAPEAIKALPSGLNPVDRYLAGRNARPASIEGYERKMRRAAELLVEVGFEPGAGICSVREFPWHCISVSDAAAFMLLLSKRYDSPKSRENLAGIVRSMLKECVRLDLLDRRSCDDLLAALPIRAHHRPPAGRELGDNELLGLLRAAAADPSPVLAVRNTAILHVFMSTGCRISEVVDLDLSDYRFGDDSLLVRCTKSNRPVRVFLTGHSANALQAWLHLRGSEPGALFLSRTGSRLTTAGVHEVIRKTQKAAGIAKHVTAHDFRRTFITRLLRAGVDPFTVRRLVNHKNVATTMTYDRRTEMEDREVVRSLQLPGHTSSRRRGISSSRRWSK